MEKQKSLFSVVAFDIVCVIHAVLLPVVPWLALSLLSAGSLLAATFCYSLIKISQVLAPSIFLL